MNDCKQCDTCKWLEINGDSIETVSFDCTNPLDDWNDSYTIHYQCENSNWWEPSEDFLRMQKEKTLVEKYFN